MPQHPLDLRIFEWFDHHGWAYWIIGYCAVALWLAAALAPLATIATAGAQPAPDRRPWALRLLGAPPLFLAATLLVFCAFRWPTWFAGRMENPDEAQWVAAALTFADGGLPWKHVDCTTSGPLNPYLLTLGRLFGLPLDYLGVRIFTTLVQAVSALILWRAARRLVPEWAARLALLPAVNLWACRWFHDMVQYSSEQAPVLLLALAGWAGAVALTTDRRPLRTWLFAAAGFCTTASLFAKPQTLPVAAALGLLQLVAVVLGPPGAAPTRAARWRHGTALVGGALAPLALFAGYLWIYGLFAQVHVFTWQGNLLYAGARTYPLSASPESFFELLHPMRGSTAAVLGVLAFALLTAWPATAAPRSNWRSMAGAWLLTLAALATIASPGRIFRHYLHFLVLPLGWLAATNLTGAASSANNRQRHLAPIALLFVLFTSAWPLWQTWGSVPAMNGQLYFWRQRQVSPAGAALRALARPGDRLVVWGWAPHLHLESALPQGAREAHYERAIIAGPLQSHHRDRLLFDLKRNQPRWFVDAVAPGQFGFRERQRFGHETWSPLRDYIAANYEQVDEIDRIRIYRRRDSAGAALGGD